MNEVALKIQHVTTAFHHSLQEYLNKNSGNEDILIQRLLYVITPRYLSILSNLVQLDAKYGEDDLKFIIAQFSESLNSIDRAEEEVQRAFFYNGLDKFLFDVENVVKL